MLVIALCQYTLPDVQFHLPPKRSKSIQETKAAVSDLEFIQLPIPIPSLQVCSENRLHHVYLKGKMTYPKNSSSKHVFCIIRFSQFKCKLKNYIHNHFPLFIIIEFLEMLSLSSLNDETILEIGDFSGSYIIFVIIYNFLAFNTCSANAHHPQGRSVCFQ